MEDLSESVRFQLGFDEHLAAPDISRSFVSVGWENP
jgi:hypothetical protein